MSNFQSNFPQIIKKIPRRDYGIDGLFVYVDHTPQGTVYFVETEKKIAFPEHQHAEQFTMVVNGYCDLTINGNTTRYVKGESYTIPANTLHQITLSAGYAEIDYVDDPND
ncbi:cupin domain-containing protein [Mannheimia massilioguelmaensis]|uniref:cupin domain-containing protein n=1 Tax=Mannheimia massilioguelmaensis TaxID=1604354 RepID=UPI0006965A8E|nr:cupin domain-containing protein [Mannheimia massilioguelmaensis]